MWIDVLIDESLAVYVKFSIILFFSLSLSLKVPRLLFDGWSYQDYMSVLDSEDEIEELGREALEVAKVCHDTTKKFTLY